MTISESQDPNPVEEKVKTYPFRLVDPDTPGPISDPAWLLARPFAQVDSSFAADARRFAPGEALTTAINTALAVGDPLLISGDSGTGKTQTAYYVAYKLGIEPVLHFQVKSDSQARDLLYEFDAVRYFYDAHLQREALPDKADYVEPRALWRALDSPMPRVLLIDEIDKAPRDFPNDLLHELDKMELTVAETQQTLSAPRHRRPVVVITSNSERRLPEPFLRRCVYHHITFDVDLLDRAIANHRASFAKLSDDFVAFARERFLELRDRGLGKSPATGEMLVWLQVLAQATDGDPRALGGELAELPGLAVLLKDRHDAEKL